MAIEKSIAEKGVTLNKRTRQFMNDSISQNADVTAKAKPFFGKKSAKEKVSSIIR